MVPGDDSRYIQKTGEGSFERGCALEIQGLFEHALAASTLRSTATAACM